MMSYSSWLEDHKHFAEQLHFHSRLTRRCHYHTIGRDFFDNYLNICSIPTIQATEFLKENYIKIWYIILDDFVQNSSLKIPKFKYTNVADRRSLFWKTWA